MTAAVPLPLVDDDLAEVSRLLRALGGRSNVRYLTIPGPPRPKARPRFNRATGNTYVTKDERKATALARGWLEDQGFSPESVPLVAVMVFYRADRRRVDGDNFCKWILDVGNHILWEDDSLVDTFAVLKRLDRVRPRTVLGWARL